MKHGGYDNPSRPSVESSLPESWLTWRGRLYLVSRLSLHPTKVAHAVRRAVSGEPPFGSGGCGGAVV